MGTYLLQSRFIDAFAQMSLHSGNLMNCTIEKGSMVVVFQGLLVVGQGTHKNSELKHSPTQRTRLESPTFRRKFRNVLLEDPIFW
uniref:Uncharacterized protein n=1 Tax=Helianthus annuus TaxID=4232 RepID=A0A251RRZ6_HELAN